MQVMAGIVWHAPDKKFNQRLSQRRRKNGRAIIKAVDGNGDRSLSNNFFGSIFCCD